MFLTDPIADMLTRIRNAQMVGKPEVTVPRSKFKEQILEAIRREGYISGFSSDGRWINVTLKYVAGKRPVIQTLKRVSKPSLRVYSHITKLGKVANGFGNAILSTSRGVLSDAEARELNVGGEVLLHVA